MPRESACRNDCGTMLHFDQHFKTETGKWIPLEPDGTPHQCPNSSYNLKNATTTVASAATQQVNPQPQQVQRDTGYPNFRVTQEDWDFVKSALASIKHQQDRLSEVYNDLSDHCRAISSMIKHEQKLADAEAQYDQDRENGSLYENR